MAQEFETTRWSLVLAAGGGDPEARQAMEWLCEAYWQPLYAFVRRRGHDPERARDLVQSFFLYSMQAELLRDVDPRAGRLRAYLLASIKHFISKQLDHERALKRRAQDARFTLSLDDAEAIYRRESTDDPSPEQLFEKRWALTVLRRATERLRQEYAELGRSELFERLGGYVTGESEGAYEAAATELEMSVGAVKTAVHRLRKRLGRVLRDEVAQTVADPEQVDDELRHLLRVLE